MNGIVNEFIGLCALALPSLDNLDNKESLSKIKIFSAAVGKEIRSDSDSLMERLSAAALNVFGETIISPATEKRIGEISKLVFFLEKKKTNELSDLFTGFSTSLDINSETMAKNVRSYLNDFEEKIRVLEDLNAPSEMEFDEVSDFSSDEDNNDEDNNAEGREWKEFRSIDSVMTTSPTYVTDYRGNSAGYKGNPEKKIGRSEGMILPNDPPDYRLNMTINYYLEKIRQQAGENLELTCLLFSELLNRQELVKSPPMFEAKLTNLLSLPSNDQERNSLNALCLDLYKLFKKSTNRLEFISYLEDAIQLLMQDIKKPLMNQEGIDTIEQILKVSEQIEELDLTSAFNKALPLKRASYDELSPEAKMPKTSSGFDPYSSGFDLYPSRFDPCSSDFDYRLFSEPLTVEDQNPSRFDYQLFSELLTVEDQTAALRSLLERVYSEAEDKGSFKKELCAFIRGQGPRMSLFRWAMIQNSFWPIKILMEHSYLTGDDFLDFLVGSDEIVEHNLNLIFDRIVDEIDQTEAKALTRTIIDSADEKGKTLFHYAIDNKSFAALEVFADKGGDVNLKSRGQSLLEYVRNARLQSQEEYDLYCALLEYGAMPFSQLLINKLFTSSLDLERKIMQAEGKIESETFDLTEKMMMRGALIGTTIDLNTNNLTAFFLALKVLKSYQLAFGLKIDLKRKGIKSIDDFKAQCPYLIADLTALENMIAVCKLDSIELLRSLLTSFCYQINGALIRQEVQSNEELRGQLTQALTMIYDELAPLLRKNQSLRSLAYLAFLKAELNNVSQKTRFDRSAYNPWISKALELREFYEWREAIIKS